MQDPSGYFYYRQYPLGIKAKTPMLHWAQAVMYTAFVETLATNCQGWSFAENTKRCEKDEN